MVQDPLQTVLLDEKLRDRTDSWVTDLTLLTRAAVKPSSLTSSTMSLAPVLLGSNLEFYIKISVNNFVSRLNLSPLSSQGHGDCLDSCVRGEPGLDAVDTAAAGHPSY